MANYIETKSTKPILSRVSYVGEYAQDVYGYVEGYLNNLEITQKNNNIIVSSGLIAVDGKRIVINDEMSVSLAYESGGGMMEYNLFLKVNMATPDNLSLVTSVIYANPSDYRNDDLFLNYDNGIKFIKLATIVNSSAGIQGIEKVIPSVKEEKENLLSTVDDLAFDSGWLTHSTSSYYFDYNYFRYRKVGKVVEISILATAKISVPNTEKDFVSIKVIPAEFRPTYQVYGLARTNKLKIGRATVNTNGGITIQFNDAIPVGDFVAFNATYTVE